jgi:microcystin-dependent protein
MSSPFVAEIRILGCNFAPKGWAFCNGQLMPISQNTALFSLLGTFYGGDGKSTFALPDFQGNAPMNQGQGSGLSDRFLGETSGVPNVTLLQTEMASHQHQLMAATDDGNLKAPTQLRALARSTGGFLYQNSMTGVQPMAFQSVTFAGGSLPHNNMQPYLTMNFCIALQGVFPPRS